jgi:hypothetical protein
MARERNERCNHGRQHLNIYNIQNLDSRRVRIASGRIGRSKNIQMAERYVLAIDATRSQIQRSTA